MILPDACRRLACASLAVLGLFTSSATGRAQAPLEFATEGEAVWVDVYVSRGDAAVQGLTVDDFEVRDNGLPQAVELVSSDAARLHVIVAVDRSQSMAGAPLEEARAAARALLEALDEADRVTLVAFDYRIDLLAGPAASRTAALQALAGLTARGPTALRDALYVALELASPEAGRPVVLILSDGLDGLSVVGEPDLLAVARGSEAAVYAFLRRGDAVPALERLCAETGGRALHARPGSQLASAFVAVLNEAQNRYVLRFSPTDASPGWHALDVRLAPRHEGLRVRSRRGYERIVRPAAGYSTGSS